MNIYVSNLSFRLQDDDLREMFEPYGEVESARVIKDRDTGRSRGFGFVEMPNGDEANEAMSALNQKDVDGRSISVAEARQREGGGGGNSRGGNDFRSRGPRNNDRRRDW